MLRISNAMVVDIDARHSAAACGSEVHRRTTRAASDFQHMAMLAHVHQVCESKPLGGGHPTALPDVFTKRTVAHRSLGAALEVCVDVVVEIHRVGHLAFSAQLGHVVCQSAGPGSLSPLIRSFLSTARLCASGRDAEVPVIPSHALRD